MELKTSFDRRILRGIARFAQSQSWELLSAAWGDIDLAHLQPGTVDGAIAAIPTPTWWERAQRCAIPTVNIQNLLHPLPGPAVFSDNRAIGRLAAGHFMERGFHYFGYLGQAAARYSQVRRDGFAERLSGPVHHKALKLGGDWRREQGVLEKWLLGLPKPVGIFVVNDILARRVLQRCRFLQLQVPQQVAVLGVGDYHLVNEVAPVAISSVIQAAEQIGYCAGQTLARLLNGESVSSEPQLIAPLGIVTRRSTDTTVTGEPLLNQAIEYIRENLSQTPRVADLASHLSVSRRWLELQFQLHLGRSPWAEIRRAQMEKARHLLIDTDWPLGVVARRCGLKSPERLSVVFRHEEGLPPSLFRERFQFHTESPDLK